MDLDVAFLGTGGSMPTARRATASLLARCGGDRLMFDCGEGTQRQMQRSTGLVPVDDIYITHFHADHYLGLPGLLKTYELVGREAPLRVIGPRGLEGLLASMRRIVGRIGYPLELVELDPAEAIEYDAGYQVAAFEVSHRVEALGYALVEDARPGHLDPEAAARLGVTNGPELGRLQRGETVDGADGSVSPEQVMGEARPGRKVVVTGDTRPCEDTRIAAYRAELLVHDATFTDEEAQRAAETGHSTAREAAELAQEAEATLLACVHISTRYRITDVLAEAREAFPNAHAPRDFDLVEVPFPERGESRLVEGGARQHDR